MLSRRAAWNTQKPSLCWGFPTNTRVSWTLARCAAPRRPGEKRRSHEARSAALTPALLLLRSRPFMAGALAGHQKGRAALPDFGFMSGPLTFSNSQLMAVAGSRLKDYQFARGLSSQLLYTSLEWEGRYFGVLFPYRLQYKNITNFGAKGIYIEPTFGDFELQGFYLANPKVICAKLGLLSLRNYGFCGTYYALFMSVHNERRGSYSAH